ELSTTFGTLSSDQVTTDANGLAAFTLSSSIAGTAEITAKASFTLPRGTELHYTGTGTSQVLVIGTPVKGYVYAEATATWQSNGSITAHKFADNNMNGVQDSGEPNLSGWKMKLYRSVGESWEFVAEGTTDSAGNYTFNGLSAGLYKVQEVLKSGWMAVTSEEQLVTLSEGTGATVNFGNVKLAVITAVKFRDDDLDGEFEPWDGEETLDNWRITLWKKVGDAWADQGTGYTRFGSYTFESLSPGTYRVDESLPSGWLNSTAKSFVVELSAGDHETVYFGNIEDICELSGPDVVAAGEQATFTTKAGFASYTWEVSGGTIVEDNGASIVWQAPNTPGTYTIEVHATTLGGAVQDCEVDVEVSNRPSVVVNDAVICRGETTTLTAQTDASNPSFLWNTGETTQSIDVTEEGTYTVTVTDGETGLSSSASGTVTVIEPPTVSLESAVTYEGASAVLTVQTNAANPSFLWSTGETTPSIVVTEAGTYSVTVTDGVTGCSAQASATLTVYPEPKLSLQSPNVEFCVPGTATLTVQTTATAPEFLWSTGETTQSIVVTEPGEYTVTVTDQLTGWSKSITVHAVGYPTPEADFETDSPVYEGQPVHFTNRSTVADGAALSYWWDFGDGQTSEEENPVHVYSEPGTYQVLLVVTREPGCTDQVVKTVTVKPLPTFKVFGYVFLDGTAEGIPGSRVEFRVKEDGRWIPAGSMVVGEDGYFSFSYKGLVEAIELQEINVDGYISTRAIVLPGGEVKTADDMAHANLGQGTYGAYIFYDAPLGYTPGCGCVDYVVFHSDREGNWDLYRLTPGLNEAPVNLTHHPATDMAPAIAPDGRVAFQSDRDGQWEIYLVDDKGEQLVRLTNHPADDTDPVWSPVCELRRLAFQSNRDGHWEIYVAGDAPDTEWRLTRSAGDSTDPYWSPDGQWITFQSNRNGNWDIYIINVATREEHALTRNVADDVNPIWSPDGQTIAFLSNRDGNWEIYTVDVQSGALRRLTDTVAEERNLAWSPDGQWLAFQSNRNGQWDVFITDPTGTDVRLVAPSSAEDQAPTWDCDSSRLIFQSDRDGNQELYIVDPFTEGAAPERLTDDPAQDIYPAWQPPEEDASLQGLTIAQLRVLELRRLH
ncbi:MAG: PD40 domain-containing protein, partial [Anaerolineae bacterium]|nr:PD40 domain-containing protein [Anaerolineae bacterium]